MFTLFSFLLISICQPFFCFVWISVFILYLYFFFMFVYLDCLDLFCLFSCICLSQLFSVSISLYLFFHYKADKMKCLSSSFSILSFETLWSPLPNMALQKTEQPLLCRNFCQKTLDKILRDPSHRIVSFVNIKLKLGAKWLFLFVYK